MKIYAVWSGEYSDKCMNALFLSKEKADKYRDLQNALDRYDYYYVSEYETEDDKVNLKDEVNKYYYCIISLTNGDIWSDCWWEALMKVYGIRDMESLIPEKYTLLLDDDIDQVESDYNCTVDYRICNDEVIIEHKTSINQPIVEVYSRKSYVHARKIAIEQYQIYTQQKLENGEL